jgi:hypothetical protein
MMTNATTSIQTSFAPANATSTRPAAPIARQIGTTTAAENLAANGVTMNPARIDITAPGMSASPAVIGESPTIICRCCDTK